MKHFSGFVSILGRPNVGKSTLMNKLVGENLSIITAKAQTTRHRIMGILNGDDFQIVYSDTPGILEPKYDLHHAMMSYVQVSLEDADAILLVVEPDEKYDEQVHSRFNELTVPVILVMNKADLGDFKVDKRFKKEGCKVLLTSAVTGAGLPELKAEMRVLIGEKGIRQQGW